MNAITKINVRVNLIWITNRTSEPPGLLGPEGGPP